MINLHCPSYICKFADLTKDLVNDLVGCSYYLSLKMLFEFFVGEYESVSELIRLNAWTLSESQFLNLILGFDGNRFLKRMRASILRRYKGQLNFEDFVLALDDTDNPKYSKYLFGVQSWRCSKGSYYGQKILVIALVDVKKKFAIPLDFRVCCPKKDQGKDDKKSGIDLAFELAVNASKDFGFLPVVADSWFDSSDLAVKIRHSGMTYVWEIKSNRKAKKGPGRHKSWKSLSYLFSGIERQQVNSEKNKWISERLIVLKSKRTQIKSVAAFNRKNGKDAFAYYASTDRCMPGAKVWEIFRGRWNIECLFHDLKSHLNFGRLSVSDDKANELAFVIPFVIITYCRLNPGAFGLQQNMTVKGMIKTLKTEQEFLTLDRMKNAKFHTLLEKIKIRKHNINKKPVIRGTEGNRAA
jgi:hypothetical protein